MVLPAAVAKYFWGDNLEEMSFAEHSRYITQTILERGDREALRWIFDRQSREAIRQQLPTLRLSAKSANFWHIYLS